MFILTVADLNVVANLVYSTKHMCFICVEVAENADKLNQPPLSTLNLLLFFLIKATVNAVLVLLYNGEQWPMKKWEWTIYPFFHLYGNEFLLKCLCLSSKVYYLHFSNHSVTFLVTVMMWFKNIKPQMKFVTRRLSSLASLKGCASLFFKPSVHLYAVS